MAIGIDPDEKYEIPLPTRLFIKFRIFKLVLLKRKFMEFLFNLVPVLNGKKVASYTINTNDVVTNEFDKQQEHYRENNWAYAPNILDDSFHKDVTNNWPSINYFFPPSSYYKCYNAGFFWRDKLNAAYDSPTNMSKNTPAFIGNYPWYTVLMNYLSSDEFEKRVSIFAGKEMVFANSVLTTAVPGSFVATHMDSVKNDLSTKDRLQLIFFINGGSVPNTGELTLTKDNKWDDIIFRPPSVINTMLAFNKSAEFYHGFKPILKGGFRWAIGAGYRTLTENHKSE